MLDHDTLYNLIDAPHPPQVVGRGSETQLQVSENLNYFI